MKISRPHVPAGQDATDQNAASPTSRCSRVPASILANVPAFQKDRAVYPSWLSSLQRRAINGNVSVHLGPAGIVACRSDESRGNRTYSLAERKNQFQIAILLFTDEKVFLFKPTSYVISKSIPNVTRKCWININERYQKYYTSGIAIKDDASWNNELLFESSERNHAASIILCHIPYTFHIG